jgi:hypothetical protein
MESNMSPKQNGHLFGARKVLILKSGRLGLSSRPPAPQASVLPGCATSRRLTISHRPLEVPPTSLPEFTPNGSPYLRRLPSGSFVTDKKSYIPARSVYIKVVFLLMD